MNKLPKNSIQYQLNGGELAANLYRKGIERARGTKEVEAVKPPKPTTNADLKPADIKPETIKTPSGKITYTVTAENRIIKESLDDEEHPFYEYLEEYDVDYVLNDFFSNPKGKQNWGVLINPDMYAKALREFTQYGKLVKFPTRYIYQWMGIIMKNTAILETNSAISGHREYGFYYEIADYANEHFGIEIEPNYESCYDWLEEQGLYDWMEMPDGHFAVTDYGTGTLFKIIKEYNEDLPPEKVLVLVNRALDVYHMQGPICSIFIQGGTKSLDKIAEGTQKSKKKVYITESQVKKIAESNKKEWAWTHFRKQEDMDDNWNLFLEYPHYYADFLKKWKLVDDWEKEPFLTLHDLCEWVLGEIGKRDEKRFIDRGKKEIYNLVANDEYLSAFVYRYIEDYIKPLKYKQDIVDRYARKENLRDIDWNSPRNQFEIVDDNDELRTYLKH
jgi:hypothetical protein